MTRNKHAHRPSGFTLVELLVVIAIIGILVSMTVTGIAFARKFATTGQISMEVSQLAQAVEDYKLKHGDYPPDFSDATVVNRHFRKAFPKIVNSELALLSNAMFRYIPGGATPTDPPSGIDRAEALVFCLGGFSEDPQRPFTGPNGPLKLISGKTTGSTLIDDYEYNTDRINSFFEFKVGRLTLFTQTLPIRSWDDTQDSATLSQYDVTTVWDTTLLNNVPDPMAGYDGTVLSDPFPVYLPSSREMPYVYFDSRTYGFTSTIGYYFNRYAPRPATDPLTYKGTARPYKSVEIQTSALSGAAPAAAELARRDAVRHYESKNTFQIIAAGYDDHFGGINGVAVNFIASTGQAFNASSVGTMPWPPTGDVSGLGLDPSGSTEFKYSTVTVDPLAQQDNIASFASGTLISNVTQ